MPRHRYTPIVPALRYKNDLPLVRGIDPAMDPPFHLVAYYMIRERKGHRSFRLKRADKTATPWFTYWWRQWGTVPAGAD